MEDLQLVSVYNLSEEEMKELCIEEGNELSLFEGDCDYMDEPRENGKGEIHFDRIYFFIRSEKNYVIVSDEPFFGDELLEFCKGQNTKVSISGTNTRSETKHWQYMDYGNNAWESYENNQNLKIAYRGGCGYVYTLFQYEEENEEN